MVTDSSSEAAPAGHVWMARADGLEVWIIRCVLAVLAIAYFGVLAFNGVYGIVNENAWIVPLAEGFTWSFVPALKATAPEGYWYHYFGDSGLILYTGLLHLLTGIVVGSDTFNLRYMQTFGSLFMLGVSVIKVIIGCLILKSRRGHVSKIVIFAMFLALLLLIPRFVLTHNLMINTLVFFQLYIYVFAAITFFIVTVPQKEFERQSGRYCLLLGAFAGVLFFDLSLFGWLVMLPLAVIAVRVPLTKTFRVGCLVVVAFVGAAALSLLGAYHGNLTSILPAIETQFLVLRQGVQMSQPGFSEQFFGMFLSPQGTYFHLHLTFVFGAATLLVSLGTHLASLRGGWPGGRQLGAILFDVAFLFAVGLHVYALKEHPTYTPAESLSLLCVYYMFFHVVIELDLVGRAVTSVRCILLAAVPVAFAATMLHLASPIDTYMGTVVQQREEGRLVRSADQLVGDLLGPVTVIDSWDIYSVSFIAYHLKNVVFMMHGVDFSGPGYDYFDRYFEPRLGGYRFLFPQYVAGVFPDCRVGQEAGSGLGVISNCRVLSSSLGQRVANVAPLEPSPIGGSYLYVLPAVEGGKLYERSAGPVTWVDATTLSRGEVPAFLATHPASGLRTTFADPYRAADPLSWSLVPADTTELSTTLTDLKGRYYPALGLNFYTTLVDVVLDSLGRGYAPYIMRFQGYGATQYILLAPAPGSRAETR